MLTTIAYGRVRAMVVCARVCVRACVRAGLYGLCDKLGLDYNPRDVEETGDVFVTKCVLPPRHATPRHATALGLRRGRSGVAGSEQQLWRAR